MAKIKHLIRFKRVSLVFTAILIFVVVLGLINWATLVLYGRRKLSRVFIEEAHRNEILLFAKAIDTSCPVYIQLENSSYPLDGELVMIVGELKKRGVNAYGDIDLFLKDVNRRYGPDAYAISTQPGESIVSIDQITMLGGGFQADLNIQIEMSCFAHVGIGYINSPRNGNSYSNNYVWILWRWYSIGPRIGQRNGIRTTSHSCSV